MENHTENMQAELHVSEIFKTQLFTATKWARFLAWLGIIGGSLLTLFSLLVFLGAGFIGKVEGAMMGSMGIFYLILGGLVIFISLFLLNFANKTLQGLQTQAQQELESGLGNLKSYFKINAILQLVAIGAYLLVIVTVFFK